MTKTYHVTEVFSTLQGEGRWAGRHAVFLRLAFCNMWTGHPEDRHKGPGACARWCDTSFAHGDPTSLDDLVRRVDEAWDGPRGRGVDDSPMVVVTGGEPTLQLDEALVHGLKRAGFFVAVETNGSRDCVALAQCDHVCVSPKRGGPELRVLRAHELKVVLPGAHRDDPPGTRWSPEDLRGLAARGTWDHKYVQPQDVTELATVERTHLHAIRAFKSDAIDTAVEYELHVQECVDFVRGNPGWRLSLQTHKLLGLR